MIEAEVLDPFLVAESFYRQSEQRPGRYFRHSGDDHVMVSAQPGCDLEWLQDLDVETIRRIDELETLSLLETRSYRFDCGCSQAKIFPLIANMSGKMIESVFGGSEVVSAGCPRCGARYAITMEALEAYRRDLAG